MEKAGKIVSGRPTLSTKSKARTRRDELHSLQRFNALVNLRDSVEDAASQPAPSKEMA